MSDRTISSFISSAAYADLPEARGARFQCRQRALGGGGRLPPRCVSAYRDQQDTQVLLGEGYWIRADIPAAWRPRVGPTFELSSEVDCGSRSYSPVPGITLATIPVARSAPQATAPHHEERSWVLQGGCRVTGLLLYGDMQQL
jgi:hypothetical protein